MKRFNIYNTSNNDYIGYGVWRESGDYITLYDTNNDNTGYARVNGRNISIYNTNNDYIQYAINDSGRRYVQVYTLNNDYVAYWMV